MPTYIFYDTKKKKEFEEFMSIAAKEVFLKENPQVRQVISPVATIGQVGGVYSKTDNTWKEVMSKIAEQNPTTPLGREYGKRDTKKVKTEKIIEKHLKQK